jgi:cell division protein FtsQ
MRVFSVSFRGRLLEAAAAAAFLLKRLVPASAARRLGPARLAILVALAVALGGAWLWFRDSPVVAIKRVTVTGLTGPGAGRIRAALTAAARGMSTLDVQMSRLHTAVQPFPAVRALRVATQFPHGLRIVVIEQRSAAVLTAAGHRLAVSADGTVLRELSPSRRLPVIAVRALPAGSRVTDPVQEQQLAVIAAAPRPLRARIAAVTQSGAHGVVVRLRSGPNLYFGAAAQLQAKWLAITAVLADRGSVGAGYIDVTDPQRPAAG